MERLFVDMWVNFKIQGFIKDLPDFDGKTLKTTYQCFVTVSTYRDHLSVLKDYLRYYRKIDVDSKNFNTSLFYNDSNCAVALVTYFFREDWKKFEHEKFEYLEYISNEKLPQVYPDQSSENHRLWVQKVTEEEIDTPKSAAYILYERCRYGKISVSEARRLIKEQFGNKFSWEEILDEFSEYGGADTKKYLRRKAL